MIYQFFKNLIPQRKYHKIREEGEFLLVLNEKHQFFILNPIMKEIYLLMNGKRTVEEILKEMLELYEVDRNRLEKDLIKIIRDMQWKNLIKLYR